ncbi:MAG: hypothetical protein NTW52_05795 [Planctomycetota bacterium]|nr:hypothetical protein [Planctomycetota bacterium]
MCSLPFRRLSSSSLAVVVVAWLIGASLCGLSPAHASNPWGRTVGEAIALRDVTRDMRNRSERLFPRTPIAFLATAQNETACNIYAAIQQGAPGHLILGMLGEYQRIQQRLNQVICVDRFAANDHGLRTYRRLVEDRFLDLTKELERCNCGTPRPLPYSTYRFDEQLLLGQPFIESPARLPQLRRHSPRYVLPEQNGFGEAVEF